MKIEKIKDLPQGYVDDWARISRELTLSVYFILMVSDKIDWEYISKCQKLSEDFIRDHQDKVDWEYISKYQKLRGLS